MRRSLALAVLALLLTATPSFAEDASWRSDPPKGGYGGYMLCTGTAEAGGHRYTNTNNIHQDIIANCDRYARADVAMWFLHRHGITIDPSIVKVTVSKP